MPRSARASAGGYCYHVINRGNARGEVFHKDEDFGAFVRIMGEACIRLPVIEGGKGAATSAGEELAEQTAGEELAGETLGEEVLEGAAVVAEVSVATVAAVGAALLILLWPSEIAPEPEVPRPVPEPNPEPITTCPQAPPAAPPLASTSDSFPTWEPEEGISHPTHDEVDEARDESGPDCEPIGYAIDVLVRDLKFRRWDMQRHGGGDADHRRAYYERRDDLRRLVGIAKAKRCPYNPEADVEITRPHNFPTLYY